MVAYYDLPGVASTAGDDDVLAAAAEASPVHEAEVVVVGEPYVFARGLDELAAQGQRLQQAEDRLAGEKAAAKQLARQFFDDGMPKQTIATTLGVARPTLDSWLGDDARRRRGG
jgi:hypothetical protein